jgi:glutathione reductase (NADPH)
MERRFDLGVVGTGVTSGVAARCREAGWAVAVVDARPFGLTLRTSGQDTAAWYNTRRVGETASGFKVLIEEGTGRMLGAHLPGPNAAHSLTGP